MVDIFLDLKGRKFVYRSRSHGIVNQGGRAWDQAARDLNATNHVRSTEPANAIRLQTMVVLVSVEIMQLAIVIMQFVPLLQPSAAADIAEALINEYYKTACARVRHRL